jgi:DNA invertase Pin-like site-specific DNA recombinase
MGKKAIAYVADIILGNTGEIIPRDRQRAAIERHAREDGIEIVAWFEDEVWTEDLLARPGIKALFACEADCDRILVERCWCLSRYWPELRQFLQVLARRNARLESATLLWDCVSQQARQYYRRTPIQAPAQREQAPAPAAEPRPVARPSRLHFTGLRRKPA